MGSPARVARPLKDEERAGLKQWAEKYVHNAQYCLQHGINVSAPLPSYPVSGIPGRRRMRH
jgi:hypothetical protein